MKRNVTQACLLMLLCLLGHVPTWAQQSDFTGMIAKVRDVATTLQEGTWYTLYNFYSGDYVVETTDNTLTTSTESPNGLEAESVKGYLIQLEKQEDGRYLIKTANNNYFLHVSNSGHKGTATEPGESSAYTITPIEGAAGHFNLMNTMTNDINYYMAAADGGLMGVFTAGGYMTTRDWTFKEVSLSDGTNLEGRDYVDHILAKGGLVRITNRRNNTYNVADNGTIALGKLQDNEDLSQIWILGKKGTGYTLRNANTGRFLDDNNDFRSPSTSATTLYIRYSPNNTGTTTTWVNISEVETFSGNVCLNENGNTPANLHAWAAAGDAGSDWVISEVTDRTVEDIYAHLQANAKYKEVVDGQIYRIRNLLSGNVLYENINGNALGCQAEIGNELSQLWKAQKTTSGSVLLQNMLSNRYVAKQGWVMYKTYTTVEAYSESNGFALENIGDEINFTYHITDVSNWGLHCDANNTVVGWYNSSANNEWGFETVEITQEEIDSQREKFLEYQQAVNNISEVEAHLYALFADKACTQLKEEIQALTEEELQANADFLALTTPLREMVLKIKNNTWQTFTNTKTGYTAEYEKFFRVADYKVYSHYTQMANWANMCMSNNFGRLSNPTGITGYTGDVVYIFVEGEISSDCTLALETVTGTRATGAQTPLKEGLNILMLGDQSNLYIFYQLDKTKNYLADYPDVKIHIEGGRLNGYWDATRGMTNADWKLLQQDLLKESPVLNLKTNNLVFCMDCATVKQTEPTYIKELTHLWNTILQNEERYMGLEEFEGRYRNIWNVFSVNDKDSYMYATSHGTYYNVSTLPTVMNYYNMTHQSEGGEGNGMWGPSHEMGHNHQAAINVIGATESSNNMFSNINQFEAGISTSRFDGSPANFEHFNQGKSWLSRSIGITTRMYFQLYLYFHVMKNDTTFLPRLFKTMRKYPLNRITYSKGSQDYLHFAKMVCDVAQADLSEFFESYGMFVPVNNVEVGDYGTYYMTTTEEEIEEARKYMQQYPRKLGNIMFIEDRIQTDQVANADNIFGMEPAPSGYKYNCSTGNGRKMGTLGDAGQYWDYKDTYENDSYYYTINAYTRQVKIKGSGAVGFKVYDLNGKLVYISSFKEFYLPKAIVDAGYVIKAAEGNGHDVIVPKGTTRVLLDVTYPGQEETRSIYSVGTIEPLPTNAVAVVKAGQTSATPSELLEETNVVDENGVAGTIVIDGNQAWKSPVDITASQVVFKKDIEGYAALNLPFAVTNEEVPGLKTATYSNNNLVIKDATRVEAGLPVVVEGNVAITRAQTKIAAGSYGVQENISVLAADGNSVETVVEASPFIYHMVEGTAIGKIFADDNTLNVNNEVYDLQGRRLHQLPTQKGIYIVGGKKMLVK